MTNSCTSGFSIRGLAASCAASACVKLVSKVNNTINSRFLIGPFAFSLAWGGTAMLTPGDDTRCDRRCRSHSCLSSPHHQIIHHPINQCYPCSSVVRSFFDLESFLRHEPSSCPDY